MLIFLRKFFQKKDPQYKEIKEDTTWTMDQFNDYINEEVAPKKGLPRNWVMNEFTVCLFLFINYINLINSYLKFTFKEKNASNNAASNSQCSI